jgi:hypothetical protein
MKVTLTTINRRDKTSTAGKPYVSLGIKTQEHGDKWLSGFGNKRNAGWKEGDDVEIEVVEKVVGDKTYLNFEMPKLPEGYQFPSEMKEELNIIKTMLGRIIYLIENPNQKKDNYPEYKGEPNFDNIP